MTKKHLTGEDGKRYVMKEKKPFYKKWWFILFFLILIFSFISSLGEDTNENKNDRAKITQEDKKDNKVDKKYYALGDSVDVGGVIYTLNSVELTDERNQFDESNPEFVVKVSYTMENQTDSESDLPVGMDVSAYGADLKKLESYPNDNTLGSVAKGKAIDVTQHFGINKLGEMELQFAPLVSLKKTADFKVNVE